MRKAVDFKAATRVISVVIVGTLALQAMAMVARLSMWTWPFMDYPMYAQAFYDGDTVVPGHFVYATLDDGTEVQLKAEDIGLTNWIFEAWVRRVLRHAAAAAEKAGAAKPNEALAPVPETRWLVETLKAIPIAAAFRTRDPDASVPAVLSRFQARHERRIVSLRIEDHPMIVSRGGVQKLPNSNVLAVVETQALGL